MVVKTAEAILNISAKKLTYCYVENGQQYTVFEQLSLNIRSGKRVGIFGASGSGKSTLLYVLSGLLKPIAGDVCYDAVSVESMTDKERERQRSEYVGFMFQQQHFFPELSIWDNVSLPLRINQCMDTASLAAVFALLRLNDLQSKYPHQLSGGESARVGMARAVVHNPKIVFADEPTAALDQALSKAIFDDLMVLQEKKQFSMIVATHDLSLLPYFDHVYHLRNGQLEKGYG